MKKTRYVLELEKAKKEWHAELWINFRAMLDLDVLEGIGVSEDRDMNINIVRLCSALIDSTNDYIALKEKETSA